MKLIKKNIYAIVTAAAAFSLYGCVENLQEDFTGEDMRINIGAKVNTSVLVTKSGTNLDYNTDTTVNITLIRWDQNSGGNATYGREELGAVMETFTDAMNWERPISFVPPQFYLNRTDSVGFAGWYPASTDSRWTKENGRVVLPANPSEGHNTPYMVYDIDGSTDVMISTFTKGNFASGVPAMQFRHALCMYKFYVYAVDETTSEEWGDLTDMKILNLPDRLFVNLPEQIKDDSSVKFTFSPEDESSEYALHPKGDNTAPISIPYGQPSNAAYIGTVLGGAPAIGALGITARTENYEGGNSVSIARNFTPGYTYNIYIRFSSKGVINAEISVSDWIYDENDYIVDENFNLLSNLSRYGTANSYIVSSGNRGYSFDGTVKGNGVNTLTRRDGSIIYLPDTDVNLNVDSVAIVRNDAMAKLNLKTGRMEIIDNPIERQQTQIIELVYDKLSNGKVVFKVKGNEKDPNDSRLMYEGNAKIAAFDAAGNIIWSWHIWVTDKPMNQGYSNGYVALDRNLGAIMSNSEGFRNGYSQWSGLYYQWGRKDPIFRATVDEQFSQGAWKREVVDHPVPVAEAHRNPVTYYYDTNPDGNNWTTDTENNDHFWGYISIRDDVKKTIYDPCPPGYRVPDNPIWQNPSPDMTSEAVYSNGANGTFAGYNFIIGNNISIYYPAAECIAEGQMQQNDRRNRAADDNDYFVFQHSATPYEPDLYGQEGNPDYENLAYHFRYNENDNTFTQVLTADPDLFYTDRSAAYPVRCVFENSEPVVTDLSASQTANSYIVSSSGFYKFRIGTRGNGVAGLNIVSGQGGPTVFRSFDDNMGATFDIDRVDKVDILWWQGDLRNGSAYRTFANGNPSSEDIENECPVTILDNGDVSDGFAMFYADVNSDTYGNVGIAAYDANNDIIWSWHIWIQPQIKLVRVGDFTLMDRNLGATYAPESAMTVNDDRGADGDLIATVGFYYQWGRKDPFFGPYRLVGAGNQTMPWFRKEAGGGWRKETDYLTMGKSSISESVENPLYFFTTNNNFWQTSYTTGKEQANDLWGYAGNAGTMGNSFAKTMYDPCPPGYRVMQHDVFETANICNSNDNNSFTVYNYYYNAWNYQYYNERFGIYLQDGMRAKGNIFASGIWFPNSGVIEKDGGYFNTSTGNQGRVSTATPMYHGTANNLNMREIRWTRTNDSYYSIQQYDSSYMSEARVVRCQME